MSIAQIWGFVAIFLDLRAKSCYDIRANLIWRCIEVVVTRTTRNRFVLSRARGFESHHLRQKNSSPFWRAVFYLGEDLNPPGEYLTPQKYKTQTQDFWLAEVIQRSEASGNPTISAKEKCIPKGMDFLLCDYFL